MTKLSAAYARCSTDDQAGSLPAQWSEIEKYAARNDYEVIERFEDDGISGTSFKRPGLQALLHTAEQGPDWQHLLVWDRSRISRPESPKEALAVTYMIEKNGIEIVPIHGAKHSENSLLDTITEALEFGQAGEESIRKSRDILRGQRACAERGSIPSGRAPYGYDALYVLNNSAFRRVRYLTDGSKLLLSPDGQEIIDRLDKGSRLGKASNESLVLVPGEPRHIETVQRIYSMYTAGESPRSIAYSLNSDDIPSPRGKSWSRTSILRILENPAYNGSLSWNVRATGRFHTLQEDGEIVRKSNPDKKWGVNPDTARILRENLWEGIVSKDLWEKAQQRRVDARKSTAFHGKGKSSNFLASGLIRCICDAPYITTSTSTPKSPDIRYEYYLCNRSKESFREQCDSVRIQRPIVDDYLERRIRELYFEPSLKSGYWDDVESELNHALSQLAQPDSTEPLYAEAKSVQQRIDRVVEAISTGSLSPAEVEPTLTPLRQQKVDIERKIHEAKTLQRDFDGIQTLGSKILGEYKHQLEQNRDLWPNATLAQRKQIVRAYVASIIANQPQSEITTTFYPLIRGPDLGINDTTL